VRREQMSFSWTRGSLLSLFLPLGLASSVATTSSAKTWHVPSEVEMIYEAVDSVACGDTVLVAPGTYYRERIKYTETGLAVWLWLKDGVTIMSEGGPDVTMLLETSPSISNYVVYGDTVVDAMFGGFTIEHGWPGVLGTSQAWDNAILIEFADAVIENNVIRSFWIGIHVINGSPHDGTPIIRGNDVRYCDYGIMVGDVYRLDTPLIEANTLKYCDYGINAWNSHPYILGTS
jgi:hypothetical protein